MCMSKPKHICLLMNSTTNIIPHDIMIDNIKIQDIRQVEFDREELEAVRSINKNNNNNNNNNVTGTTISYNPYSSYDDSDSDIDSDVEYTDEKIVLSDKGLLPLPVTTTVKGGYEQEKITILSKVLLVLIGLMLMSMGYKLMTAHFCGSTAEYESIDTLLTIPTDTPKEYEYTERLNELYRDYST